MNNLIKHINAIRNIPVQEDAIKYKIICELIDREGSQFEEKTGEWIDHQLDRWIYAKCSKCGSVHNVRSNYCPSCGARMIPREKCE